MLASLVLTCPAMAAGHVIPDMPCADSRAPEFADYAVAPVVAAHRPALRLDNDFARKFRTSLSEGLANWPVDFAGHYVMVTHGCGTTCMLGGWVDAETGEATPLPFMLDAFGPFGIDDPLLFRADSRLVAMLGVLREEDGPPFEYYYEWTGTRLEPLCYLPLSRTSPGPEPSAE